MPSEVIQVLLVEDNLGDARLLFESMEEALPGQFQMTHVRRLDEALEHLWKETCHVVLLDLGLPDSHGIDTLVLARAQAPGVAIVVLTGFQDEEMGDRALKEGAQDYLVKGQVDSKQLARSMHYAISRKAVAEAVIGQELALAKASVLRASRLRMIEAHERIRREAADYLRDEVLDGLLVMKGYLKELLKGIGAPSEMTQRLGGVMGDLNRKIEQQVEALSDQLYPAALDEGIVATFDSFRHRFGDAPAIEIELDEGIVKRDQADCGNFPEKLVLGAYRIAEEALSNAVEHARAVKVIVRLDMPRNGQLRLTVRDNGRGFDPEGPAHGLGLGTMQDYAESLEGEFSVQSDPDVGTLIKAEIPLSRLGDAHMIRRLLESRALHQRLLPHALSRPVTGHLESLERGNN
jgi:signal transduction histidine kinase